MPKVAEARVELPPVFHDWALAFEHETTREGLAYWNALRGERPMPAFSDLHPRGMKSFIANVSVIDCIPDDDGNVAYSVRLTGERVREHYGAVARRKLREFLPVAMERRWRQSLDRVRATEQPLRVHGRMSYADNIWLYQETLLAPLRGADSKASMFLLVTAWWPAKQPST
jgi:hypothetical protein